MTAWLVAVTGSYVMNSSVTFAAESGRKLRWRAYAAFVVSGVPEAILIGRDGRILWRGHPADNSAGQDLRSRIETALAR